ncbi:MAG: response regulator transcription factor [Chloroflexota bacterium]
MSTQKDAPLELRRVGRRSLLVGIAASLLSLMLGLLFQTVFYGIASAIPSVIRQDAHISLPLCEVFPGLYGCAPWVGALTSLQIFELSQQVGQAGGLLVNLLLVAVFSAWLTLRTRSQSLWSGLLAGVTAAFAALLLALAFDVPLTLISPQGTFGILVLSLLPLSGWIGGRIGKSRLARPSSPGTGYFLPGDATLPLGPASENLSPRELEVLVLVAEGFHNREIAQRLSISNATVKTHLLHIFGKLGVKTRTAAVRQALAYGLLHQGEEEAGSESPSRFASPGLK